MPGLFRKRKLASTGSLEDKVRWHEILVQNQIKHEITAKDICARTAAERALYGNYMVTKSVYTYTFYVDKDDLEIASCLIGYGDL